MRQHAFDLEPARTLLDLLEIAAASRRMGVRTRSINPTRASDCMSSSTRMQFAAAGCLRTMGTLKDALGRYECDEILRSPIGHQTLECALKQRCRMFLTQPEVQAFFQREWQGPMLSDVFDGVDSFSLAKLCGLLRFCCAYLLNLFLLPLVALCPSVETAVFEWLRMRDLEERKSRVLNRAKERGRGGQKASLFAGARATSVQRGVLEIMKSDNTNSSGTSTARGAAARQDSFAPPPVSQSTSGSSARSFGLPNPRELSGVLRGNHTLFDWHLYRTPIFKYSTRLLFDFLIAVALSSVNLADHRRPLMAERRQGGDSTQLLFVGFALWAIGGCYSEYRQVGRSVDEWKHELQSFFSPEVGSMYRADVFNDLDLFFFHVVLVAVLVDEQTQLKVLLWSLAVVLSWVRLLRFLQLFSRFGPLILMLVEMCNDVFHILVINAFVLFALTFGTFTLFNSSGIASPGGGGGGGGPGKGLGNVSIPALVPPPPLPEACEDFSDFDVVAWSSWPSIMQVLANGMVSGDNHAACFRAAGSGRFAFYAWLYSYVFVIATGVLILNMLIAMMAKTFDSVWESAEINSQCLFARAVFYQAQRPPEPPPLNILRAPSQALWFATRMAMLACRAGSPLFQRLAAVERLLWSTDSLLITHLSPASTNLNADNEYVGTNIDGRNTFANWKKSMTTEEKREMILDFMLANQDEEALETRWRSKMLKRVTSELRDVKDHLGERLEEQENASRSLDRKMQGMMQTLHTLERHMSHLLHTAQTAQNATHTTHQADAPAASPHAHGHGHGHGHGSAGGETPLPRQASETAHSPRAAGTSADVPHQVGTPDGTPSRGDDESVPKIKSRGRQVNTRL